MEVVTFATVAQKYRDNDFSGYPYNSISRRYAMMYIITPVVQIPHLTHIHFCTPLINLVLFGWKTDVGFLWNYPENVSPQDGMKSKSARKVIVDYCHEWRECPHGKAC